MKTAVKLPDGAVNMAGRVGKEVRIIFNDGKVAQEFAQNIFRSQLGWKPSDGYMSRRMPTLWPQRRKAR